MKIRVALLTLFAASLGTSAALGWGAEGHEAICEIAYQQLEPKAQAAVRKIMSRDRKKFRTLRQGCGWPDRRGWRQDQRKSRGDHYINVPRHWSSVFEADCPPGASSCLFNAIRVDRKTLESDGSSDFGKLVALKFLGHWVGDIHQPLHVSYKSDKGGNYVELEKGIGCRKKLHDVWDNCIPEDRMKARGLRKKDREGYGKALHAEITPQQVSDWTADMELEAWASESLALAREPDVEYCVLKGSVCWYSQDSQEYDEGEKPRRLELTDQYEDQHGMQAELRLKQAGVRLGALLNEIFED